MKFLDKIIMKNKKKVYLILSLMFGFVSIVLLFIDNVDGIYPASTIFLQFITIILMMKQKHHE